MYFTAGTIGDLRCYDAAPVGFGPSFASFQQCATVDVTGFGPEGASQKVRERKRKASHPYNLTAVLWSVLSAHYLDERQARPTPAQ